MSNKLISALIKITLHYSVVLSLCWMVFASFPEFLDYFPVGTSERMFTSSGSLELGSSAHAGRLEGEPVSAHVIFFFTCFLSSILLTIPVGIVYLSTHKPEKINSAMAKAILILPIAVTGLVLIVQNSLALAFGLAGIVAGAGIRFRTNVKEFTDTLFFMITIGIGLAAGVGSLGLAAIMSMVFCYAILTVYLIDYGKVEVPKEEKLTDSSNVVE